MEMSSTNQSAPESLSRSLLLRPSSTVTGGGWASSLVCDVKDEVVSGPQKKRIEEEQRERLTRTVFGAVFVVPSFLPVNPGLSGTPLLLGFYLSSPLVDFSL